jgi:tetratricopeptide (TPR) repeat protein
MEVLLLLLVLSFYLVLRVVTGGVSDPKLIDAKRHSFGLNLLKQRDYSQAFVYFDKMLEIHPDSALLWYGRGKSLSGNQDYFRAITDFRKAIDIDYRYGDAYLEIGLIYKELNDWKMAYSNADKCVRTSRNKPEGYLLRGTLLLEVGRNQSAFSDLRRAVELGDEDAQFELTRLKQKMRS